jgi:metal-responsive CopG/Arc/MetJ family transcriptional regulator
MSNGRTTQILGFSVPPVLVKEVESFAKEEQRTKSELFREMVRVYRRYRQQRNVDELGWVKNLIREAKEEQRKNPMSVEELLEEDKRLAKYGASQAKKLGIKTDMKSINKIIHERRKLRRP